LCEKKFVAELFHSMSDPRVAQLLSELGHSVDDDSHLKDLIGTTTRRLDSLESRASALETDFAALRSRFSSLPASKLSQSDSDLTALENFFSNPSSPVLPWLTNNAEGIAAFIRKSQMDAVLSLARNCLGGRTSLADLVSETQQPIFLDLPPDLSALYQRALAPVIRELYATLRSDLEGFAVADRSELATRVTNATLYSNRLAGIAQLDSANWERELTAMAVKLFGSRLVYHTRQRECESPMAFVIFTTGLLRTTVQSILVAFNPAEKLSKTGVYQIILGGLFDTFTSEILSRKVDTLDFFRSLFEYASVFDNWLQDLGVLLPDSLCDRVFDQVKDAWMATETAVFQTLEPSSDEDFGVIFCTALSQLANAIPRSISANRHLVIINTFLVPSATCLMTKLRAFGSSASEIASAANALVLVGLKLKELFELSDEQCEELKKQAHYATESAKSLSKKAAQKFWEAYSEVRRTVGAILTVVEALEGELEKIARVLERQPYCSYFMPELARIADEAVDGWLRRVDGKREDVIAGFRVGFQTLERIFGYYNLVKLGKRFPKTA
jgi:hypothetical protein